MCEKYLGIQPGAVNVFVLMLCVFLAACTSVSTRVSQQGKSASLPPAKLNPYVVRAVEMLARDRANRGYGNQAFTQDLQFGNKGTLAASGKPLTMCVAAQMEVLVEALNIYTSETADKLPFEYLPKSSWLRLGPTDLRGQIWMVDGATASGAADALRNFGMGARTSFEKMEPGDFMNFNRTNGTGHGVIFMAFLDAKGNELAAYSDAVAGFKYFSSQGKLVGGGLDYRFAFFTPVCPALSPEKKRDCWVIRSASQRMLNLGYAWLPPSWDSEKARTLTEGRAATLGPEGGFDENYFTGVTTDD
jgi:hypothetical protein